MTLKKIFSFAFEVDSRMAQETRVTKKDLKTANEMKNILSFGASIKRELFRPCANFLALSYVRSIEAKFAAPQCNASRPFILISFMLKNKLELLKAESRGDGSNAADAAAAAFNSLRRQKKISSLRRGHARQSLEAEVAARVSQKYIK